MPMRCLIAEDFPTSTVLCVTALASPDFLVEIEGIAVWPD